MERPRKKRLRHRPEEALAASCVLVVCRMKSIGRTEKELLAVCACTKRHLALVLRDVNRVVFELSNQRVPTSNTRDVIERFCANMNISFVVASTAKHIVQVALALPLRGYFVYCETYLEMTEVEHAGNRQARDLSITSHFVRSRSRDLHGMCGMQDGRLPGHGQAREDCFHGVGSCRCHNQGSRRKFPHERFPLFLLDLD
jgi:hypothetical protein